MPAYVVHAVSSATDGFAAPYTTCVCSSGCAQTQSSIANVKLLEVMDFCLDMQKYEV